MSIRKRTWKNADGVESTRWIVDIMDANGHRERRQFESRKEADAFRIATEGQMRAGTFRGDASKFTVKDAADRFLEHCEGRRQRGERMTRQNYKTMDGHIGNYICRDPKRHEGKVRPSRLKRIRRRDWQHPAVAADARSVGDFRDRLRDAGVTVVTTRKILSTFSSFSATPSIGT